MSKSAPSGPTPLQTANFIAWQKHVTANQGLPLGDVLATFMAAQAAGNALAEIETACSQSPDICGFDP
jgi:hypothetical protein